MARMYSRKHGRSRSTKPKVRGKPAWVSYTNKEIEKLVVDLFNKEYSTAEVGMILRDQYGIPSLKDVTGKKILDILKEKNISFETPEDLKNLLDQAEGVKKHLKKNKSDGKSVRSLELIESKIRRLGKYYKRKGRLPLQWSYKSKKIK